MARAAKQPFELVIGDTSLFTLELFDDRDVAEDLSAATRARLVIDTKPGSGSPVLDVDTDSEMTINTASNTINVQLTQSQADGLTAGVHVAELAVEFGAGTWRKSDRFYVEIAKAVAANLA